MEIKIILKLITKKCSRFGKRFEKKVQYFYFIAPNFSL